MSDQAIHEADLIDPARLIAVVEAEDDRVGKDSDGESEVCRLKRQVDSFEEDHDQLQKLCDGVDEVKAEQDNFRQLLDELHAAREKLKQVSASEEDMTVPLQYEESHQRALFEKCMGLEFRVTEDRAMCLVYRFLDPCMPEAKFSITIDIDDHNQWTVIGMEPHVHGVRTELNELNKSGNFTQFCKAVRSKFKEYATTRTEEQ